MVLVEELIFTLRSMIILESKINCVIILLLLWYNVIIDSTDRLADDAIRYNSCHSYIDPYDSCVITVLP